MNIFPRALLVLRLLASARGCKAAGYTPERTRICNNPFDVGDGRCIAGPPGTCHWLLPALRLKEQLDLFLFESLALYW